MKLLRPLRWLLLVFAVALIPAAARAEVVISVGFAPPPLLVYEQPPCPEMGLIWMPGYWAYGDDGYYWVPGAWVPAPYVGALWTPGYWGWNDGMYYWHPGYWGPHVGYYGGINYGFGYFGVGFVGGRWSGGFFEYNTAVWRVNTVIIHRTYVDRDWNRHYADRDHDRRIAFNGGPGGIRHDPDRDERAYMREPRMERTSFQTQHIEAARSDRGAYYNVNHGRPDRVVVARPLPQENRPAPGERGGFNNNSRGNNASRNGYEDQPNRSGQNPVYRDNRNNRQAQPEQPQYRTQPGYRQVPPQRQVPESRPQQPEYRPQPQPQQPQYRTQPEYRQVPPQRQVPESRPPQPEYRGQPQPQQPQYRTQPEYRQVPPQRQAPESRPPQPEYRGQPQPQRQPEYRPQPQSRPEPQGRPEPQQRPENHGNGNGNGNGNGGGERQEHGHGR